MTDSERLLLDALNGNEDALRDEADKTYDEYCKKTETPPVEEHNPDDYKKFIEEEIEAMEQKQALKEKEKMKNAGNSFSGSSSSSSTSSSSSSSSSSSRNKNNRRSSFSGSRGRGKTKQDEIREFHEDEMKKINKRIRRIVKEQKSEMQGDYGMGRYRDVLSMHHDAKERNKMDFNKGPRELSSFRVKQIEIENKFLDIYKKIKEYDSTKMNPY